MVVVALVLLALVFWLLVKIDAHIYDEHSQESKCCDDSFCEGDCGGWGA